MKHSKNIHNLKLGDSLFLIDEDGYRFEYTITKINNVRIRLNANTKKAWSFIDYLLSRGYEIVRK